MREKEKLLLKAEKMVGKTPKLGFSAKVKNVAKTVALAAWLAFAQDAVAQDVHSYYPISSSWITIPYQAQAEDTSTTISWDDAAKLYAETQDLQETVDTEDSPETPDTTKKDESKISIGWMFEVWSGVAADAAEVCSTNPELLSVLNMSHKKTGLWISLVRLDDFSKDMSNPCSQVTIVNPYWSTKLWPDGKFSVTAEWKYTFFDKIPELNGFSPDIKLAYSDKGWTVEAMYIHKFQKWADSDAFRLSVSKTFDEILQLTTRAWFETGYDKHFYGQIIATVDLGHGFLVEMSFIAKYWKITPTAWILYRFQK